MNTESLIEPWSVQEWIGICTVQSLYNHGWLSITLKTPIGTIIAGNYEVSNKDANMILQRHIKLGQQVNKLNTKLCAIQQRRKPKPSVTEEEQTLL